MNGQKHTDRNIAGVGRGQQNSRDAEGRSRMLTHTEKVLLLRGSISLWKGPNPQCKMSQNLAWLLYADYRT